MIIIAIGVKLAGMVAWKRSLGENLDEVAAREEVVVHGLSSRTDLNGKRARVELFYEAGTNAGRYKVRIEGENTAKPIKLALHAEHLRRAEEEP